MHASVRAAVVLCVGLPLHEVTRIARSVRHGTVVLAASDSATAQALLESVDEPVDEPGAEAVDGPVGGPIGPPVEEPVGAPVGPALELREASVPELVRAGQLTIDVPAREVLVAGRPVHLSPREFELLSLLASDLHRVWPFSDLVRAVWGTDYLGDHDQLASTVKRLRKRLGRLSGCEVHSVHGVGYRLRVEDVPIPG